MPSESRPFDPAIHNSAFESGAFQPGNRPLFGKPEAEPVIDDFNTFFEKLSALEESGWSDELAPAVKSGAVKSTTQPKPEMKLASRGPANGGSAPRAAQAAPARPSASRRVPAAFKLAMSALALFIVGMTIGWAVLNGPQQLDQWLPSLAKSGHGAEWPADPAASAPIVTATPIAPAASGAAGTSVSATTGSTVSNDSVIEPIAPTAAAIGAGPVPIYGKMAASVAKPAAGHQEVAAAKPESAAADEAQAQPVATSPAHATPAQPAAPAAATSAGDAAFALQVGACRSSACVDNYRRLVSLHVDVKSVRVVASPGSAGVQRVRVEPLAKHRALELKQALAQADPRLKSAYLVRITR